MSWVLTKRCAFRHRVKVAVDSVDRRSSAGKLFHNSGPETAEFLRPTAVAVRCTSSLLEAADRRQTSYQNYQTINRQNKVLIRLQIDHIRAELY